MIKLEIWTDGSVNRTRGNICSYAYLIKMNGEQIFQDYGPLTESKEVRTGNRAEMTGLIKGLEKVLSMIKESGIPANQFNITFYSDSQYCVNGINEWIFGWKMKNWVKVKNVDLWKYFYSLAYGKLAKSTNLKFEWIRGHSGIEENEIVDKLCKRITVKGEVK